MPPLYDLETIQLHSSWKAHDDDPDNIEKTKCVQFESEVAVFEISNVEDEDRLAYWMSREEYVQIRDNCVREVRLALQQCATSSPDFRGLEHRTPQGLYRRFHNRLRATKAVLTEQERQKVSGFLDPEWIATIYKEICHRSIMEAKIMGMRDEVALSHDNLRSELNLQDLKSKTITHYKVISREGQRVDL